MTTPIPTGTTPGIAPGALPVSIAPLALDPAAIVELNRWAARGAHDPRPWYRKVWPWLLIAPAGLLALLLIIGMVGAATASATTSPAPTVSVAPVVQEAPIAPLSVPETHRDAITVPTDPAQSDAALSGIYSAGTYVVGRDIQPGDYWTRGPDYGDAATWQRLSATDGAFDSVITAGIAEGPTQITIKPTDNAVHLTGGAVWTKVS
jgi:hypothetical protein